MDDILETLTKGSTLQDRMFIHGYTRWQALVTVLISKGVLTPDDVEEIIKVSGEEYVKELEKLKAKNGFDPSTAKFLSGILPKTMEAK